MRRGLAALCACLTLQSLSHIAHAEVVADPFLICSAEFYARYEYNRGLLRTNAAHQQFLMDRSEVFLDLAEARAPKQEVSCGSDYGSRIELVYCLGPADLSLKRKALSLDRLANLVEQNGPDYPLPVCMEDAECSACIKALGEVISAQAND